ncbi:hypothetical protein MELA_00037 [Candidatus Methylomirabilis lanthanidiphila]|uniref:Uncharacterized protein n=1 Tax=Candidatus Methylomirabilis lanthanidiphila TaxID=2211376 RepID=A0A564ZEI9_9BACT|nr:hypothetical protein MELA_00037 [Candidatus Methylomirabilis lanthanidiphila]
MKRCWVVCFIDESRDEHRCCRDHTYSAPGNPRHILHHASAVGWVKERHPARTMAMRVYARARIAGGRIVLRRMWPSGAVGGSGGLAVISERSSSSISNGYPGMGSGGREFFDAKRPALGLGCDDGKDCRTRSSFRRKPESRLGQPERDPGPEARIPKDWTSACVEVTDRGGMVG